MFFARAQKTVVARHFGRLADTHKRSPALFSHKKESEERLAKIRGDSVGTDRPIHVSIREGGGEDASNVPAIRATGANLLNLSSLVVPKVVGALGAARRAARQRVAVRAMRDRVCAASADA